MRGVFKMKGKKLVIIPIILLLIILAIIFFNKNNSNSDAKQTGDMSPEEAAQEIKPYIKDMEVEEIKEILNQELTEKQKDTPLVAPMIFR